MSIDYGTYVGPYARCAVGVVETVKERRSCMNALCPDHERTVQSAFCRLCGSPVGDVSYIELDDAIDDWAVRENIDDRLVGPGGDAYHTWKAERHAHLWMPNIKSPGRHLDTRADFELYDIPPDQVRAEIEMFQSQFAADLAYLREQYGADVVTLHWGIIQDYS